MLSFRALNFSLPHVAYGELGSVTAAYQCKCIIAL